MKNKKITLNQLQVKSFITSEEVSNSDTLKGGNITTTVTVTTTVTTTTATRTTTGTTSGTTIGTTTAESMVSGPCCAV